MSGAEGDLYLSAMSEALRDLEQYARIEQVIPTKILLRKAIAAYRPRPLTDPLIMMGDA